MVVAVQGRNDLAAIDPDSFTVTERISTPGCDHPTVLRWTPPIR
jgi:hypothetical protein